MKGDNLSWALAFKRPSRQAMLTPYSACSLRLAADDPASQARLVFPGSSLRDGRVCLRRLVIDDGLPPLASPDKAISLDRVQPFLNAISHAHTLDKVREDLIGITHEMGFQYVALTPYLAPKSSIESRPASLDNYPAGLIEDYWGRSSGVPDPIVDACLQSQTGFLWSKLPDLICMSDRQMRMLSTLQDLGVAEGFTVPQHYPGDVGGSCSFVTQIGRHFPRHNLAIAQLIATFAVEAVRRIAKWIDWGRSAPVTHFDQRQMDRMRFVTCDATDQAVVATLGLRPKAAAEHLDVVPHLCEAIDRYRWVDREFPHRPSGLYDLPGNLFLFGKMLFGTQPTVAYDLDGSDDRETRGGYWGPSFHDFCGKPPLRFSASRRAGAWGTTLDLNSISKEPARNRDLMFVLSFPGDPVIGKQVDSATPEDFPGEDLALPAERLTEVYLGSPCSVVAESNLPSRLEWHSDDDETEAEGDEPLSAGRLSALYFGHRKVRPSKATSE